MNPEALPPTPPHCWETVMDKLEELVLITDLSGKIQYVNQAFERTFGYSRQELVSKHPDAFIILPMDKSVWQNAIKNIKNGGEVEYNLNVQSKQGAVIEASVKISSFSPSPETPTCFICIARDLKRERQLQSQLHEVQRMEAMGRLARGIAHRFNNVLGAISGQTELLQARGELDSFAQERTERILKSIESGQELVAQIKGFVRKQHTHTSPVDLSGIMRQSIRFIQSLTPAGVSIKSTITEAPCHVMGIPEELHQIMLNLINNAVEAMPNGGELEVTLKNVQEPLAPQYKDTKTSVQSCARIRVKDTGHGISGEHEAHLFEPFFTTRNERDALGMGLTVLRATVDRYKGKIHFYSAPDQGTVFEVYLPLHVSEADQDRDLFGPSGKGENILLLDDESYITEAGCALLSGLGYHCDTLSDPKKLDQRVNEKNYDLIIIDMSLPERNGLEYIGALRAKGIRTPVILTTPLEMMPQPWESVAASIDRILTKPCPARDLSQAVRAILDNKQI